MIWVSVHLNRVKLMMILTNFFLDCTFILYVIWCVATLFIQDVCFQHKSLPADALCVLFYSFFFLYCSPFLRFFHFWGTRVCVILLFSLQISIFFVCFSATKNKFFSVFIDRRWKKQIKKKHLKIKKKSK